MKELLAINASGPLVETPPCLAIVLGLGEILFLSLLVIIRSAAYTDSE